MTEGINLALLLTVIGAACYAACSWQSEEQLGWIAARLLARRHALRMSREAHSEALAAWTKDINA